MEQPDVQEETTEQLELLNHQFEKQNSLWRRFLTGLVYGVGFAIGSAVIAAIIVGILTPIFTHVPWVQQVLTQGSSLIGR